MQNKFPEWVKKVVDPEKIVLTIIHNTQFDKSVSKIEAEEEFIYSLNRFNVLTSRATAKIVIVCSWNFLNHLSNDRNILEQGAKIRQFAIDFCNSQEKLQIGQLKVDLRYRKV